MTESHDGSQSPFESPPLFRSVTATSPECVPTTDLIILGSGAGGSTLAYALRNSSLKILVVERGDFLPKESQNWDTKAVFGLRRYRTTEVRRTRIPDAASIPRSTTSSEARRSFSAQRFFCDFAREILRRLSTVRGSLQPGRSHTLIWSRTTRKPRNAIACMAPSEWTRPSRLDHHRIRPRRCLRGNTSSD